MPFNLDVVDGGSDRSGLVQNMRDWLPDAIVARDVNSMVNRILDRVNQRNDRIRRLRLWGHGNPGEQIMGGGDNPRLDGSQSITLDRDGSLLHRSQLIRLTPHLSSEFSWVELHGCYVARDGGRDLCEKLAHLWGVPVYASADPQLSLGNPITRLHGAIFTGRVNKLNAPIIRLGDRDYPMTIEVPHSAPPRE